MWTLEEVEFSGAMRYGYVMESLNSNFNSTTSITLQERHESALTVILSEYPCGKKSFLKEK